MMLTLLLMFLFSEPWNPEHVRRFVAGKYVRVILTSAATACCVWYVHKIHKEDVEWTHPLCPLHVFHVKMNPRLSLLLRTNTRAQKCCSSGLLSQHWTPQDKRLVPGVPTTVRTITYCQLAFFSHKRLVKKFQNPNNSQVTQYIYFFLLF